MKKFLAFIKSIGVAFHLAELRRFVQSLVEVPELAAFVNSRISDIDAVVKLITDADPDNKKQLRKLFEENRERLVDDALILAAFQIEQKLGATQPERAEYLANALREIAALDLFPVTDEPAARLAAISTANADLFTKIETSGDKKGKKATPFMPVEPEPHRIPAANEPETIFQKADKSNEAHVINEAARLEDEAEKAS